MKNITTWRPDTCGCEIDYKWDTDKPAEMRTHTVVRAKKCNLHSGGMAEVYESEKTENTTKNKIVNKIMEDSEIAEDVLGEGRKTKPGIEVKWSFDDNRKLEVEILGINQSKKDLIKIEIGKVIPLKDFILK